MAYRDADDAKGCSLVLGCDPARLDRSFLDYRAKNRYGWIGISKVKEVVSGNMATVSYVIAIGDHANVPLLGGPEIVRLVAVDGLWKIVPPKARPKETDKPHLLNYITYLLGHPEFQREQAR